jgi:hypothetical protein
MEDHRPGRGGLPPGRVVSLIQTRTALPYPSLGAVAHRSLLRGSVRLGTSVTVVVCSAPHQGRSAHCWLVDGSAEAAASEWRARTCSIERLVVGPRGRRRVRGRRRRGRREYYVYPVFARFAIRRLCKPVWPTWNPVPATWAPGWAVGHRRLPMGTFDPSGRRVPRVRLTLMAEEALLRARALLLRDKR